MKGWMQRAAVASLVCLAGGAARADNVAPAKDGSCIHHTLADKTATVKLANGEKYEDRYPKREAGANTQHVLMPLHIFQCKDGRMIQLQ